MTEYPRCRGSKCPNRLTPGEDPDNTGLCEQCRAEEAREAARSVLPWDILRELGG